MPYKILFFAFVGSEFSGIEQKIIAQFDALVALGVEIHMFLISKVTPSKTFASEIAERPGVNVLFNSPEKINNPWARRKEKFDLMTSALSKFDPKSSIVYFRDPLADIFFLRFLKRNKDFIFVTENQEIQNTILKGKLKGRFVVNILELLWGRACRNIIKGFVSVTTEITAYERSIAGDRDHYFETIGNGIDLNRYPLRIQKNVSPHNEIRILFIGSGFRTHGLDRLIRSLDLYYKNKNKTNKYEIKLKIAGNSSEMNLNKKLVGKLNLTSQVVFLGNLEIEDLNDLFNWAHIGVGSLGIHRKGLSLTSELKAREYCARGLPFFWSTVDQDFSPDFPYILQVPESNNAFNMDPVISFAVRMTSEPFHPIKMRHYAIENLDWSVKMKKLKSFLDGIDNDFH